MNLRQHKSIKRHEHIYDYISNDVATTLSEINVDIRRGKIIDACKKFRPLQNYTLKEALEIISEYKDYIKGLYKVTSGETLYAFLRTNTDWDERNGSF